MKYLLALMSLVLVAWPVLAQDEEESTRVIPYYQSYTFNVPLPDGWQSASTTDYARFIAPDDDARLEVHSTIASLALDGLQAILAQQVGDAVPSEALYETSINLANGTWFQRIYQLEDGRLISAFANARNDRTYVIFFSDESASASVLHLIVPLASEESEDRALAGIHNVRAALGLSADTIEQTQEALPSGTWTVAIYDEDSHGLGLNIGNATYVTLGQDDAARTARLADAFNTVFLGFFTTPDNTNYLILGLVVSFVIMGGLVASLGLRWNNARKDLALVEQLAQP